MPLQSLYGDVSGASVDLMYIESLRDRSERYDWSIEAHTHAGLHQVVFLFAGRVEVDLDGEGADVPAPAVIAIPASVVHSFDYQPESSGFMLTIADGLLHGSPIRTWLRTQLFERPVIMPLDGQGSLADRLMFLTNEVATEQQAVEPGRVATIDWLTRTVLVLLARESRRIREPQLGNKASDLFPAFRGAVEAHFTEHWPVERYAEDLHVSESSLNRLCRSVAGVTVFELVQERLELEARRRLTFTTVPIHRLAADLGFSDPSYFARFFRRRSGLSPREFRAEHQAVRTLR